ncbi:retrovirus-related pol polyprotein from transposon TNT 1-94 [Tanacetum coccineum]
MTTLAEFMIIAAWPTIVQEDGTTRTKKYEELLATEKIQVDCDLKATNIVLQGLPPDVSAIVNHHEVAKEICNKVKLLMQGTKLSLKEKECLDVLVFTQGEDPIACLNKAMAFLSAIASSRFPSTNNQLRTSSNPRNQATIQGGNNTRGQARVVKCYNFQAEGHIARKCTQPKRLRSVAWFKDKAMLADAQESGQILDEEKLAFLADLGILDNQAAQTTIPNNVAFQNRDLDAYDSDCEDVSNAKAVLMANLSNYGSNVISEPPLYDGSVINGQHVVIPVIDDEETLILEELNQLSEDFGKRFVPQQELSAEQAFWLQTSNPNTEKYDISPIRTEAPSILPKDILLTIMNSSTIYGDSVNLELTRSESCDKCFDLDAELLKKQNAYNDLMKMHSRVRGACLLTPVPESWLSSLFLLLVASRSANTSTTP